MRWHGFCGDHADRRVPPFGLAPSFRSSAGRRWMANSVSSSVIRGRAVTSSERSFVVRPDSSPASIRAWRRHVYNVWSLIPRSRATSTTLRPVASRSSAPTAELGGVSLPWHAVLLSGQRPEFQYYDSTKPKAHRASIKPRALQSPQIIPMALSPPASHKHPLMPPPSKGRSCCDANAPRRWGHRLPCCALGRHIRRPSSGSLSFRPTALPPPPSDPRSPGRPGHRLLELQRPKLGKDSTSSSSELLGVHAQRGGPEGPPSLVGCSCRRGSDQMVGAGGSTVKVVT